MARIFTATIDHSGARFCTEVFKRFTDYPAFYEQSPCCEGQVCREINNVAGITKMTREILKEKLAQILRDSEDGNYMEANQMFIKSYVHLVTYKKELQPIYVIYLHRNPVDVLLSYDQNLDLSYFLQPHWSKNLSRCTKGMSFNEIVLWQWTEVRERFLLYKSKFAKTFDLNFEDLSNAETWKLLFQHFDIKYDFIPSDFAESLKEDKKIRKSLHVSEGKSLGSMRRDWNKKGRDRTIDGSESFLRQMEDRARKSKEERLKEIQ